MKSIFKAFLCFLLFFTFSCGGGEKSNQDGSSGGGDEAVEETVEEGTTDMNFEVEDSYKCSMDCEEGKEYEEAGACPVCGMELKHVDEVAHDDSENHDDDSENHEEQRRDGETKNELTDD